MEKTMLAKNIPVLAAVLPCALIIALIPVARAQMMGGEPSTELMLPVAANGPAANSPASGNGGDAQVSATASATASANAPSGAEGSGEICRAESSSNVEATLGNQIVQKSAHKHASQSGPGCHATAQSSASAQSNP